MLLVNTCVFDSCCQTTLLGWTILQSEDERLSLSYKGFSEVFGTDTSEQYRPSMKAKPRKEKKLFLSLRVFSM